LSKDKIKKKVLIAAKNAGQADWLVEAVNRLLNIEEIEVTIFNVLEVPITSPLYEDQFKDEIKLREAEFKKIVAELNELGCKSSVKVVIARDVGEAILEEVEEEKFDLIVMTGKIVEKLIRKGPIWKVVSKSKVPVLFVPLHER